MAGRLHVFIARTRTPLLIAGILVVATSPWHGVTVLALAGGVLIVAGLALTFLPERRARPEPVAVQPPVLGRWVAINSPADRVPSHGTRELGQTFAIDLVHQPTGVWQAIHPWPPARRPQSFPAFGQPILAPAEGVVVRASGWQRDHWSRNSWPALIFLIAEGFIRQILSLLTLSAGRFVLGNHVILDLRDGTYAVFAHLKRASVQVRKGQRVAAGEVIGRCGNSGNTSEPHLHFQLMDHRVPMIADGLPFAFSYEEEDKDEDRRRFGVPGGRRPFTVRPAPTETS